MSFLRELWDAVSPETQGWIFVMLYVNMIAVVVMS